jgi:hypothetical protein
MLQIGDEVLIVDDGGQYCFIRDEEWLRELRYYDQRNVKGFVGETAIISILFEHGDALDGWVYGLTLPSGENLIYEEYDEDDVFLEIYKSEIKC